MRTTIRIRALGVALALVGAGCNAILGNEEGHVVAGSQDASEGGGGAANDASSTNDASPLDARVDSTADAMCVGDACPRCFSIETAFADGSVDAARPDVAVSDAARPDVSSGDSGRADAGDASARDASASDASDASGCPPGCPCSLPNADGACKDGQCVIATCRPGFRDANMRDVDGCEAGDVPPGAALWLMADRDVTEGAGGLVTRWGDQSGANMHAVQAGTEMGPRRVMGPTGAPMLDFNGSQSLKLPDGFTGFSGASFFAAVQGGDQAGCAGILHLSNGEDIDDIEFGRHELTLYYEVLGKFLYGAMGAFETARPVNVSIIQQATKAVELRINGILNGATSFETPLATTRKQNYVGKNVFKVCSPFIGQIGEILLYARGVSEEERLRIERYFQNKWKF